VTAEPGVAEGALRRARRWLGELGFREILWAALAVFLAATALFGGLDAVNTKVTPMNAGEPFNDGEFTITIERATAVDELRAGRITVGPKTPGLRYLGVVATLRNDGTVPGQLYREIDLRGQPHNKFLGTYRMRDSSQISALGPGLTETIVFVWQLPQSALQPGTTVSLRVWRKQFQELPVSYGKVWIDSIDEYGEIHVPVKVNT